MYKSVSITNFSCFRLTLTDSTVFSMNMFYWWAWSSTWGFRFTTYRLLHLHFQLLKKATFRNDGGYRPKEIEEMETVNSWPGLVWLGQCRSILHKRFWDSIIDKTCREHDVPSMEMLAKLFTVTVMLLIFEFLQPPWTGCKEPCVEEQIWVFHMGPHSVWKGHVWLCCMQEDLYWNGVAHINLTPKIWLHAVAISYHMHTFKQISCIF